MKMLMIALATVAMSVTFVGCGGDDKSAEEVKTEAQGDLDKAMKDLDKAAKDAKGELEKAGKGLKDSLKL